MTPPGPGPAVRAFFEKMGGAYLTSEPLERLRWRFGEMIRSGEWLEAFVLALLHDMEIDCRSAAERDTAADHQWQRTSAENDRIARAAIEQDWRRS